MTPLKELFALYGLAALFPATRLLHRRVEQLELENQMLETKLEEEREEAREDILRKESDYKELQERVFVRKENLQPLTTEEKPIKITKKKASRIRELIAQKKRAEIQYYSRLESSQQEPSE
jgi:hypothetical protein